MIFNHNLTIMNGKTGKNEDELFCPDILDPKRSLNMKADQNSEV